jgi:xanthine dehydrogenase YagS FAD-binding subunit
MKPFNYVRASHIERAIDSGRHGAFLAGGTTLVDLMRIAVMEPTTVIDISGLPFTEIELTATSVRIGALAKNSDVAVHPIILEKFPAVSEALLSGASPQIRNAASIGGNLLQRTRCPYFRDLGSACNKRAPGSGCGAIGGYTRTHAILGTSDHCIATHPSDLCVALVALDAVVHVRGSAGERTIAIGGLHTLPASQPHIEHVLRADELITHVELPMSRLSERSRYIKVRDRASFAFALASAAVALDVRDGRIADARLALGGIATKPWRSLEAERVLVGAPADPETYRRAATAALTRAETTRYNQFKVELARRTIVRTLTLVGGTR